MSSHHVIRDGQEPPVLILHANGADHPLLADLLEWSPLTLICEEAVPEMLRRGFKMDHILCRKGESQHWKEVFNALYPVRITEIDKSFVSCVEEILGQSEADMLHVLGEERDRYLLEAISGVVLFTSGSKWSWHREGNFRKWFRKGTVLQWEGSFSQLNGSVHVKNETLQITQDGMVNIGGIKDLWIGEPLNP